MIFFLLFIVNSVVAFFVIVKNEQFYFQGKHARFKKYVGHSAHVTNVRWVADSSILASIGGADTAILLWKNDSYPVTAVTNGNGQHTSSYHGDSEDSDTDEEEEGTLCTS